MKLPLIIACLFSVAFAVTVPDAAKQFRQFMGDFNKVYTPEESATKFANFMASLERIEELNANGDGTVYGINQFADMSEEEFRSTVLMKTPVSEFDNTPYQDFSTFVPDAGSFDWREKNGVTAVKNQGQCGSCWAFSATEAIESAWMIGGHGTVDLSPQQIVDCDHNGVSGCNGGTTESAYGYIHTAGGQDGIAQYPYTAKNGVCRFSASAVEAKISSYKKATSRGDENSLQSNLVSWGPLSICLDAASWQHYTGGVMTSRQCCLTCRLDHCVQLVGYNSTSSPAYWIVRNSWGASWGIRGYIHLEMGGNTCGLTDDATWPTL